MRVISGIAKGIKLESIDSLATRPTLDRVKEALFSILQPYLQEAKILDLFAGSGALGIEALSRGASSCVFCEKSREAAKKIKSNVERTHLEKKALILQKDYKQCLQEMKGETFDIIFLDPPYKMDWAENVCREIVKANLLKKNGYIIWERSAKRDVQTIEGLKTIKEKNYKTTVITFLALEENILC